MSVLKFENTPKFVDADSHFFLEGFPLSHANTLL